MLLQRITLAVTLALSGMTLVSCTNDEKNVDEAVKADKDGKHKFTVDKDGKVNFKADIVYFNYDDYTLTQEGMARLDALAGYLKNNKPSKLKIEGHCDERGTTEYNLALGQLRATSVIKYLSTIGVSNDRLESVSFGEERPAASGRGENFWAQNRRAEFVFTNN